jgi:GDP-D-mannose 3',5'-epimerase
MTFYLVAGGGGFIGGHLVSSLLTAGHQVKCVDIKPVDQWHQVHSEAENFVADLGKADSCLTHVAGVDEIYDLAADMGGMGFIENNKALCMLSVLINTHLLMAARELGIKRYLYSSSACVYAANKQTVTGVTALKESDAYPAEPEDGYGWEKLFSERMCRHYREDFGIETRVARFHNVYGPYGTYEGGREKAPAAICRKVIAAKLAGEQSINIWGDGEQTRSFMYVDDCIVGTQKLMNSGVTEPLNVGSSRLISINGLVTLVENIADVKLKRNYDLSAPMGVRGRNSDNELIRARLGWEPRITLEDGLAKTYAWIYDEMTGPSGRR